MATEKIAVFLSALCEDCIKKLKEELPLLDWVRCVYMIPVRGWTAGKVYLCVTKKQIPGGQTGNYGNYGGCNRSSHCQHYDFLFSYFRTLTGILLPDSRFVTFPQICERCIQKIFSAEKVLTGWRNCKFLAGTDNLRWCGCPTNPYLGEPWKWVYKCEATKKEKEKELTQKSFWTKLKKRLTLNIVSMKDLEDCCQDNTCPRFELPDIEELDWLQNEAEKKERNIHMRGLAYKMADLTKSSIKLITKPITKPVEKGVEVGETLKEKITKSKEGRD